MSRALFTRRARNKLGILIVLAVASGLVALGQQLGWRATAAKTIAKAQPGTYAIDHFIDGDTIAVRMNGVIEKVRFIGVDTPETHKPNVPVQCYGENASAFTKQEIGTNHVRLEADPESTDRDRYNRLLRYIYLSDGTNLDEALIQNGYGFYYPYFPFTKSAQFSADEQQAQAGHKGLWQACHPTPTDNGGYVSNSAGA